MQETDKKKRRKSKKKGKRPKDGKNQGIEWQENDRKPKQRTPGEE